jgi:hypothetical protein
VHLLMEGKEQDDYYQNKQKEDRIAVSQQCADASSTVCAEGAGSSGAVVASAFRRFCA